MLNIKEILENKELKGASINFKGGYSIQFEYNNTVTVFYKDTNYYDIAKTYDNYNECINDLIKNNGLYYKGRLHRVTRCFFKKYSKDVKKLLKHIHTMYNLHKVTIFFKDNYQIMFEEDIPILFKYCTDSNSYDVLGSISYDKLYSLFDDNGLTVDSLFYEFIEWSY